MKITTLLVLSCTAIVSAIAFLASTYGAIDAVASAAVFTATLLAVTAVSDYAPRRRFAIAHRPSARQLQNSTLQPISKSTVAVVA